MACKSNLVSAFIWLNLASFSQVRGRRLVANQIEGYDDGEGSVQGHHSSQTTQNLLATLAHPSSSNGSHFIQHWAAYITMDSYYFGTSATINVWGVPDIKHDQVSATVISIGHNDEAIQVGVHVLPELYHNNKLHFFTRWRINNGSSGCYNLRCQGFVLVNSSLIAPGYSIKPLSVYGGQQYVIKISIKKDPITHNWLVLRNNDQGSHLVGYWPNSLFKTLGEYGRQILWGGTVSFTTDKAGPAMGSGHYSSEGKGKAAYLKNIDLFNAVGEPRPFRDAEQSAYSDKPDCYKVSPFYNSGEEGGTDGRFFYFGGPAGCAN